MLCFLIVLHIYFCNANCPLDCRSIICCACTSYLFVPDLLESPWHFFAWSIQHNVYIIFLSHCWQSFVQRFSQTCVCLTLQRAVWQIYVSLFLSSHSFFFCSVFLSCVLVTNFRIFLIGQALKSKFAYWQDDICD